MDILKSSPSDYEWVAIELDKYYDIIMIACIMSGSDITMNILYLSWRDLWLQIALLQDKNDRLSGPFLPLGQVGLDVVICISPSIYLSVS